MTVSDHQTTHDQTTDELEAQIAVQREHLAETIDQLGHKLDVKEQARVRLRRVRPGDVLIVVGLGIVAGSLVWARRAS